MVILNHMIVVAHGIAEALGIVARGEVAHGIMTMVMMIIIMVVVAGIYLFNGPLGLIIWFIIIALIIYGAEKYMKENRKDPIHNFKYSNRTQNNQNNIVYNPYKNPFNVNEDAIEDEIQAKDELFNKAEFLSYASDLFIKLQYAWADRDLESIRAFETVELFEQTQNQINRYIASHQINKIERVSVNVAKLYGFEQQGDRDCLSVIIESKMIDYIIDEKTKKVLKGDPNLNKVNLYILTFVRKTGSKTNEDGKVTTTMNCPNCGAATTITSSGKCPYCGSIITTRDSSWSLSSLKKYNPNM
jgi:predicted lipid-binding transport protein (Tim44 family)